MTVPDPAGTAPSPVAVSVIIPHLNTPTLLERCLVSVAGQQLARGEFEILVVDNGSRETVAAITARFGARLLHEPAPGPGLARNTGAAAARGAVLAFIDADCRAAPGWLQAATDAVTASPDAAVGGDIRIDFGDAARPTAIEAYEAVFGFRQRMYIEVKHFSVTANLAMTPALLRAVGPFAGIDTAEDLDWGTRAHAAGHRTRYVPAMRVYHPARSDFAALERKWQRVIRHDWNAHVAAGAPRWQWVGRAAALLASVPVEAIKMFTSDRIDGAGNRFRGVGVLARTRAYRATEMLQIMARIDDGSAAYWNRQA
jgi:glycosyltransferase involved in cell wall biosynthesis